jgi:hypothetical protein
MWCGSVDWGCGGSVGKGACGGSVGKGACGLAQLIGCVVAQLVRVHVVWLS